MEKNASSEVLPGSNLEARGQNLRLRAGAVALLVGLGLAVYLNRTEVPALLRLVTFAPFFVATYAALQGL